MLESRRIMGHVLRQKTHPTSVGCTRADQYARSRFSRLLATPAILALLVCVAAAQTPKSFLWKVTSGSRVMYLAGSIHALSPDVYPLNPAYQRAFDAAGALVEEIDLGQAGLLSAAPLLMSKGMFQDGRTFNGVVSKETADLVASHLKNTPLAGDLIQTMKPWMVAMLLDTVEMQQAGMDPNLGLDKHFFDEASAAGKQVIGLETAEYQIDRFDTMPIPMQEQLVRSTIADIDAEHKDLNTIVAAWRRGDAPAIEKTLLGSFTDSPAAYKSLVVERNHNWLPQLDKCLTRETPCFVVVGAAHLVGPDGLLALLQHKGYHVEQQ